MITTTTATETKSRRIAGEAPQTTKPPEDERPPDTWPKWALKMRWQYEAEIKQLKEAYSKLESQLMDIRQHERERKEVQYALAPYGEKDDLSVIKERVALHPTFSGLPEHGKALVAQVAHAMGINPFVHLHAWIDNRNNLNMTLDYKGLLYLAGEENIMIDAEKSRLLTRQEMIERGVSENDIDNGAVGAVCYVIEIDKAARCKKAGIDYHPVIGRSVWYPVQTKEKRDGSTYTVKNEPPNGRDGAWVAEKNALRAALYQISDLSLKVARPIEGVTESDDGWTAPLPDDESVLEGEFTVSDVEVATQHADDQASQDAPVESTAQELGVNTDIVDEVDAVTALASRTFPFSPDVKDLDWQDFVENSKGWHTAFWGAVKKALGYSDNNAAHDALKVKSMKDIQGRTVWRVWVDLCKSAPSSEQAEAAS